MRGNPFFYSLPVTKTDIKCRICGEMEAFDGTNLCDPCWELERRIKERPDLALKILAEMAAGSKGEQ